MYSPRTSSKNLNISIPATSSRPSNGKQMSFVLMKEEFQNREETMDFDSSRHGLNASGSVHRDTNFHPQISTGLMRYRSAPSSLLANFVDGEGCEDFLPRPSSPEPDNVFARFISCDSSCLTSESRDLQSHASPDLHEMEAKSATDQRNPTAEVEIHKRHNLMSMLESESEVVQQNGFSGSQIFYQQAQNPGSTAIAGSYRINTLPMDSQVKNNNGPSLIRHSSSPAGLFSHLTVENGYPMIRPMSNFRAGNSSNCETVATSRLKNQSRFSRQDSSTGLMSQISEMGESMGASSSDDGSLGNGSGGLCYIPGFPWDDSPIVSENFAGLQGPELASARKRLRDINEKMLSGFNSSESQNGETVNHGPGLSHHFSLPKTSAEMAAMEKLLQLQDAVPCKIRAKRGHATHPRSIAERVRRTRISERIRKLQELVPNMDKQTNTADMLDLAVEYIKELQKQVKTLSDNRARCTCSSKQKTSPAPAV